MFGKGNLLDVLQTVLALTLVLVGGLLSWQAFAGKYLGRLGLASRNDHYPDTPEWYHRLWTFFMGLVLVALGAMVLLRVFTV
jgi:hypothetical protein